MSNRQQRRQRRDPHGVKVPDGTLLHASVLRPSGEVAEVTNFRQLPDKVPGVHRWQVFITHYLDEDEAAKFAGRTPSAPVLLGVDSVSFCAIGCIDCEVTYDQGIGHPCRARDEWSRR